ncbi:MAG: APC family permease [Acidimicrobiia bacterium]|nr:APC family permease [Acidimicrobiia bacterium]
MVVGIGSMIGAGVFAVWAPAAAAAGTGLLVGLAIAGAVAWCNATSSAQLAAVHPESGGTYVYGRRELGAAWGFLAGWGFVIGKTASCAAMALTIGAYAWPGAERLAAAAAVAAIVAVNIGGLTRTAVVTRVLLVFAVTALAVVVVVGWSSEDADIGRLTPLAGSWLDHLRAAGFLFFAFAGYARIATLGEEVRDPVRTIPRAIRGALAVVLVVYIVVAVTALSAVPAAELAASDAPLRVVVESGRWSGLGSVTRVGAGIAALGALLNMIPGVSRTVLAMARRRDLPGWLAGVDTRRHLPLRAELIVAAVVAAVVLVADLRDAIGFSGVAVLVYYAITNASALRLPDEHRRAPRIVAGTGLLGCLVLALALPVSAVVAGAAMLAGGLIGRAVLSRSRWGTTPSP